MDVTFRDVCLVFATVLILGCGSNSATNYPDAQKADSGISDTVVGETGADAPKPPPMSGAGNVRLFGGPAQLLISGAPCTSEVGATGDRWCGFTSPSTSNFGNFDLFVVNVSRAAAGVAITCGGTSADRNCLRLTGGFGEDDTHAALFQGDTLVYFDLTGTPYGWRPGMLNGRALALVAGRNVHDCFAARKGTAMLCLQDLPVLPGATVIQSDLLAGRLDASTDPPLIKIETVISNNPADGNAPRFQDGFPTPDGDMLAWSSRATPTGPEILKVQRVDDAASRRTVASDVFGWSTSPGGTHWYWLSQFGPNTAGSLIGDLVSAPFPDGAGPITLIAGAYDYIVATSGTIAAHATPLELKGIVDPIGAPTTVTSLDTGVRGLIAASPEGHVAYLKNFDPALPLSDVFVKKVDGTGRTCTLTAQIDGVRFGMRFLPGSAGVLWARVTSLSGPAGSLPPIDATLTNLADCSRTIVASRVSDWDLAADSGIAFLDQADAIDGTLRFRNFVGGALATDPPTLINTRVDRFVSAFPSPGMLLYTVNAGSAADGLYVHALPAGQVGADAGAMDTNTPDLLDDAGPDLADPTDAGAE